MSETTIDGLTPERPATYSVEVVPSGVGCHIEVKQMPPPVTTLQGQPPVVIIQQKKGMSWIWWVLIIIVVWLLLKHFRNRSA